MHHLGIYTGSRYCSTFKYSNSTKNIQHINIVSFALLFYTFHLLSQTHWGTTSILPIRAMPGFQLLFYWFVIAIIALR